MNEILTFHQNIKKLDNYFKVYISNKIKQNQSQYNVRIILMSFSLLGTIFVLISKEKYYNHILKEFFSAPYFFDKCKV